jgi:hypothetical protein
MEIAHALVHHVLDENHQNGEVRQPQRADDVDEEMEGLEELGRILWTTD